MSKDEDGIVIRWQDRCCLSFRFAVLIDLLTTNTC